MKKGKKKGMGGWIAGAAVLAVFTALFIFFTSAAYGFETILNISLQTPTYKLVKGDDGETADEYVIDFDSVAELEAHDKEIAEQLTGEGTVLLKNENAALPLADGAKVSCFSQSSVDVVTCGGGSAEIDCAGEEGKLYEALTDAGLQVNRTLWNFYESGDGSAYRRTVCSMTTGASSYAVSEVPVEKYTTEVKNSFASYADAAIVVLSRQGTEFADMAMADYVDGTNALALSGEERDMLSLVRDNFSTVVVLLNTANPMELGFLDEYDVDACLWMGYAGQYGLNAVADILVGKVNPSGRLVDTFCYDNTTAPAAVGFYGEDYANATDDLPYMGGAPGWFYKSLDGNKHYSLYQEDIYVGYRYYETRYEDAMLGRGNASSTAVGTTASNTGTEWDYDKEVAYPFGFGMGYSSFAWSDFSCKASDGETYVLSVTVKNTGELAGKDVVEVYAQAPYTAGGTEKSAVVLCGFAKTGLLEAGESQTVTVEVDKSTLASYDAAGEKTYVLDGGEYFLTAAQNAHAAINNILTAKGVSGAAGDSSFVSRFTLERDTASYATAENGTVVTNRFDNADGDEYGLDITYLSRADWVGTCPDNPSLTATDEMLEDMCLYETYEADETDNTDMPVTGADNGKTLAMYKETAFDDESWETLLDQCTFDEMAKLVSETYHNTIAMPSVAKPATLDDNGPQGFTQALSGVSTCRCAYTDENIMAATWNTELMEEVGRCIGNDMLSLSDENNRIAGLYGPAMNMHRTAYGGRNFEYYSEDGFLAGKIAAAEVRGVQSKGIYVYIKHFALNDQETECRCVSTFATEQAIRELYLKPFYYAVTEGQAHAVMNSFARFGCTWSGAHAGLLTDVLRGEWGFDGFVITDYNMSGAIGVGAVGYDFTCYSFDIVSALLAGTDGYDCSTDGWYKIVSRYEDDPVVVTAMRQATKRILYTVVHSAAMNGISESDSIQSVTPWWKTALIALDVVLCAGALACVGRAVCIGVKNRRKKGGDK